MNELHGGNIYAHRKCLDFSANLNPLGMPDAVRQAVIENAHLWTHYPDPECLALREKLSHAEKVSTRKIVCGNGADDLIWRIVQALRPKTALLAVPTFSEYRQALKNFGCCVETVALSPENGFVLTKTFLNALHPNLDLVILCNPNNPTGRLIPPELMEQISRFCEENGTFLLSDECFLDLVENRDVFTARQFLHPKCIVLNAFTKTYAMPGLRLGYAIFGDAEVAERTANTGQYWSVSTPAQIAGMAALDEKSFLEHSRHFIKVERKFLMEALQQLHLKCFPSDANFILFQAENELFQKLLDLQILIRSCDNFEGLHGTYYRIAVRPHHENLALLDALRRWI